MQDWRWLEHLTNAFYALVLVVWEPIYVACGFSLYLNRRTALEAWDIELVFRRLRQRLSSSALALLLAVCLLLPIAQHVWAAEPAITPDSPRLLNQPLTSQASRDSIKALLEQPPFKNKETVTRYRFGEDQADAAKAANDGKHPQWLKALLGWLDSQRFSALATLIEVLLWGAVIGAHRLADLALPRLAAGVRQPPPDAADKQNRAAVTAASFRPGPQPRNPARRHRRQRRKPLADQPARSPGPALSRPAQPLAARLRHAAESCRHRRPGAGSASNNCSNRPCWPSAEP